MNVTVHGHSLEVAWHGPPPDQSPTIVLLHEGLGSVAAWRDWPATLARETGLGVLVYSRLGYGGSGPNPPPWPLTYMHDEARVTLPALLDQLAVRQALLVGHSDGGSIALLHAALPSAHRRVVGLVTLAAHVFCEDVSVTAIAAAREAYLHGDLRERLRRYQGDRVDGAFLGWNGAWLDPAFRHWSLVPDLPGIVAPLLVIQGHDDPYGTLAQVDAIERGVSGPVSRLILPGCGHSPWRERPAETTTAVRDFARSLCSVAPAT